MSKKITKKVMTVEIPKTEMVDEVESIVAALASLENSQGWAVVVKILNDNIAYLEQAILEKIDPVSKIALTEGEVDICRYKRELNIELRDTPKNYAKVVKGVGVIPTEYDPYFKTSDEIKEAERSARGK